MFLGLDHLFTFLDSRPVKNYIQGYKNTSRSNRLYPTRQKDLRVNITLLPHLITLTNTSYISILSSYAASWIELLSPPNYSPVTGIPSAS